MKKRYPTDLTDAEWKHIEPFVPAPKCRGRQRIHTPREILDAVFYVLRSGCPWRLLPREYPPWKTPSTTTSASGESTAPSKNSTRYSAGIADSQSVKTTGVGGEARGYDGGKKIRGRKRHLLVDTEGLVLKAKVHSAKIPEQDGLKMLLESARAGVWHLKHLWLDAGYEGRGRRWAEEALSLSVEVVRKPAKPTPEKVAKRWAEEWAKEGEKVDWQRLMPPKGFQVLPRRWVVERTFSWLSQNRMMSKDYERLCATAEAFIYAAMARLMVRRLARA